MKFIPKFTILFFIAIALVSCKKGEKSSDHDHSGHDHSSTGSSHIDAGYPLTTCVVSGEALGSMGTPIEVTHEGTTVKLCCKSCIDEFNATPAVYAAKVKQSE